MAGVPSLTTHVLDTMRGKPAAGMRFDLLMLHGDHTHHLLTGNTNADGRGEGPLLSGEHFRLGEYQLVFHVGQYFERIGGGDRGAVPRYGADPVHDQRDGALTGGYAVDVLLNTQID